MIRPLSMARVATLAALLATAAAHAQPTTRLAELLAALPEPPATPEQAAQWVDRAGKPLHPGLLAQREASEAHKAAANRILSRDADAARAQTGYQVEALSQGMADIGIDMQRMQSDPAYAAQVQERLRRMTPAEQMALAQRMNAPMQQDRRITNEAKSMAEDNPAATAAYEAGQAYSQAQAFTERRNREVKLWQETEAAIAKLNARKLEPGLPKPAMEYDNIGCQAGCRAQWEAYAARMLPLMVAREAEALRLRHAALQKQRAWLAAELAPVDRHMAATSFGARSTSRVHREQIVAYDIAAVGEIQALYDRLLDTARHAAIVVQCGRQAVLVPGAVCTN
jgi:hypothetical protein